MKKLIPLCGLPRSGSTVLMHILNQNPNITVNPDSSLPETLSKIKEFTSEQVRVDHLAVDKYQTCVRQFCKNGITAWINELCHTDYLVDKSRWWLYQYDFITQILPKQKFILTLRDLRGVVNSMERAHRDSLCTNFANFYEDLEGNFFQQRVDHCLNVWFVKLALVRIKELLEVMPACRDNFLIFRYENLIENPQESLNHLYDFLDIPRYTHDFNHIIDQIEQHDNFYQPYGNHKIQPALKKQNTFEYDCLPDTYADYIYSRYSWYYQAFYPELVN